MGGCHSVSQHLSACVCLYMLSVCICVCVCATFVGSQRSHSSLTMSGTGTTICASLSDLND